MKQFQILLNISATDLQFYKHCEPCQETWQKQSRRSPDKCTSAQKRHGDYVAFNYSAVVPSKNNH